MKTVTQLMRNPSFDDVVIHDDITDTVSVCRVHSDGEYIEMRGYSEHEAAEAHDVILMTCG